MKTKITLICFLIAMSFGAKAQTYVTIPDANFVTWLQSHYPTCMNGNQMDITCAGIQNATYALVQNNIINLTGIEYFINLQTLDCSNNQLTSLPALPNSLQTLYCQSNHIASLPVLPNSLIEFHCYSNNLTSLPALPNSLLFLYCYGNHLSTLPSLPNSIQSLDCHGNLLTSLPSLPTSLTEFYCNNNHLTGFPPLPNSLNYLYCYDNLLTSLPPLPNSLFGLYCTNNHLTSLPSLSASLMSLDCTGNQITNLPSLPASLKNLNCSNNPITNLPALPNLLAGLICRANQLTSLPVLPNSLLGLDVSSNLFMNLPVLPNSLTHLDCENNLLTSLPTLPNSIQKLQCSNNQLTSLPAIPNLLQELRCSNNQLTSLPALPNMLLKLFCTFNQLTSLPTIPNSLQELICNNNQLAGLPTLSNAIQELNCANNNISCFPIFPNTITNTFYISGNPFTCLPNYISIMTPATKAYPLCMNGDLVSNPNGCLGSNGIIGNTYKDNTNNCRMDAADQGYANVHLKLFDNSNILMDQTYSFSNGIYQFLNPAGTYTVKIDTLGMPFAVNCAYPGIDSTVTITAANPLVNKVNFGIACKPGFDVGVQSVSPQGLVFPGLQHRLKVIAGDMSQWYHLNCATGVSGQVQVTVTGPVVFDSITSSAETPSVAGNVFTYTIADFGAINNLQDFGLLFSTDTTAQAGDQICVNVIVTPTIGDNDTSNNNFQFCYVVSNSYDPNMKEVYPVNVQAAYQDYFTYTIHFQNTGTAPAMNIRLTDTLDGNLNLETFQVLNYSHYNTVSVKNEVLTFHFPNIQLPDSTSNLEGSQGFVQYRIKPKANLPLGTQIKNTANIYFDYNAAVVTNTTTNEYVQIASISENKIKASLNVYPNPGNGKYFVKLSEGINSSELNMEVYNLMGELVLNSKMKNNVTQLDLSNQPNGIYILRVVGGKQSLNQHVVKQ